ncbi:MAG: sigma-70 family RNA polymerase sigma factor [Planctomycetales bacterium]|nr:sigma-70 family RNA polymerase sigma factor [Planctomycetales bacterium]
MDEPSNQDIIDATTSCHPEAFDRLVTPYSERLLRLIDLRLDRRILGRVGSDDILQEVHMAAYRQLPHYLPRSQTPFYVWLRAIAVNKLLEVHRRHLGTKQRDARRESADRISPSEASSHILAQHFVDRGTSPSNALMREEIKSRLETCIDRLAPSDRDILALRHFEQLSPTETAHVLQLTEKAAGMRYTRALRRLKSELEAAGGALSAWNLES